MFTLVFALALCGAVAAEETSSSGDAGGTAADSSLGSIDSSAAVDSSCSDSDSGSTDTSTSESADMSSADSKTIVDTSYSDAGAKSSTVGEVTQKDPTSDEIVQDVESKDEAKEEENSKEIIEMNSTTETAQEDVELEEDAIDTTGIVMQSTDFNCGPAALATVLNNLGIDATEQELAILAGTDESGTTMYGLAEAAKAKGLNAVGMKLSADDLKPNNIVFITIDSGPHYSVVREVTENSVRLADPSLGNIEMTKEKFDEVYSGNALVVSDPNAPTQEVSNSTQANRTAEQTSNGTDTNSTSLQSVNNTTLNNEEMQNIKGKSIYSYSYGDYYGTRYAYVKVTVSRTKYDLYPYIIEVDLHCYVNGRHRLYTQFWILHGGLASYWPGIGKSHTFTFRVPYMKNPSVHVWAYRVG